METIRILRAGFEIGRATAEKLDFARRTAQTRIYGGSLVLYQDVESMDDPKLFTAKDASGKPLFVVRVSEDKDITTEKI